MATYSINITIAIKYEVTCELSISMFRYIWFLLVLMVKVKVMHILTANISEAMTDMATIATAKA